MKVGDIVRAVNAPGTSEWMEDWIHLIIGPGDGDWDWELFHAGHAHQKSFTWYAIEEELELVVEESARGNQ